MKICEKLIASLTNFLITRFEPYYNLLALRNVWVRSQNRKRRRRRKRGCENVADKKKEKRGEMENWHKDKEWRRWSLWRNHLLSRYAATYRRTQADLIEIYVRRTSLSCSKPRNGVSKTTDFFVAPMLLPALRCRSFGTLGGWIRKPRGSCLRCDRCL